LHSLIHTVTDISPLRNTKSEKKLPPTVHDTPYFESVANK
jgi:hypothetical protein